MVDDIVLYDLASKGRCHCWSNNTWKVRLVLNYKGIPYKTEFMEYPDITPTLKAFHIAPHEDNDPPYTIPAIKIGDEYLMDSTVIVEELERRYPEPSLKLNAPKLTRVAEVIVPVAVALRPIWLPKVPKNLLREDSVEYFNQRRAKDLGMSLEEYAKQGGELYWTEAFAALDPLVEFICETEGPFVEGDEVSYTDFRILSILLFIKRIDQQDFERLMTHPKALPLKQQFEACVQWIEKDD